MNMLGQTTATLLQPYALSKAALDVLDTLIYFDIFNYPLSAQEIFERCSVKKVCEVEDALIQLVHKEIVYKIDGFFLLHNNAHLVQKRLKGNAKAIEQLKVAKFITSIIKKFPFVQSVMLSGSISKNYMDEDSDIDYFIVTKQNRLWVCRLFFIIFQKLVFLNKHKYFCYNYMIAENNLAIADKTYYTAIETCTVLPMYNYNLYKNFREANNWTTFYLPNYPIAHCIKSIDKKSIVQKILEMPFNNKFGEWLDIFIMKKIEKKWRKNYSSHMFNDVQNLQLNRNTAKAHKEGHYNRIMALYETKRKHYQKQLNILFNNKTYLAPLKN